jgi:hypothetical protein
MLAEPLVDGRDGLVGPPFYRCRPRFVASARQTIVVAVEPAPEPSALLQWKARDERLSLVAGIAKPLGERRERRSEGKSDIVVNAVPKRRDAGEERCVRRQRQRRRSEDVRETRAAAGQIVENGSRRVTGAVAAEAIGAKRVDRYHDDIGRRPRRRRRPTRAEERAGAHERAGNESNRVPPVHPP